MDTNEIIDAWAPVGRAWREEPGFRDRLAADPTAALADKGLNLPPGVGEVRVAENTADTFHVIIPAGPAGSLSDGALEGVSGGIGGIEESLGIGRPPGMAFPTAVART